RRHAAVPEGRDHGGARRARGDEGRPRRAGAARAARPRVGAAGPRLARHAGRECFLRPSAVRDRRPGRGARRPSRRDRPPGDPAQGAPADRAGRLSRRAWRGGVARPRGAPRGRALPRLPAPGARRSRAGRGARGARLGGGRRIGPARRVFAGSRLLVFVVAAFAAVAFPAGIGARTAERGIVHPFGGWPLGGLFDSVLSPFVRWDAFWYLRIAEHGYQTHVEALRGARVFFPVYPLLVGGAGGFADNGVALIGATVISLVALAIGLRLLHRLTAIELGAPVADATVLLLAFAPVAFFFSAPYTESVFLLASVGAFLAARRGRWALAGLAAAVASGTRSAGALLLLPLLILYLFGPRADREGAPRRPGW